VPTYEYACKECGEHHEAHQSFTDPALTECPRCGGPLRKVFGSIGIAFKGSGFYKTDSRTSAGNGKKAESAAASSGSSTGDSSSSSSSASSATSNGSSSSSSSSSDGASSTKTSPAPSAAAAS
jgi:putative FmdB family regulatory protein